MHQVEARFVRYKLASGEYAWWPESLSQDETEKFVKYLAADGCEPQVLTMVFSPSELRDFLLAKDRPRLLQHPIP